MDIDEQIEAQRRELARSLDYLTSAELRTLAGITEKTEEAWRKRHTGPAYVRLGNGYYYPRAAVAEFMAGAVRERRPASGKDFL